jgi:hypothetical protein
MKKISSVFAFAVIVISVSLWLSSCKKNNEPAQTNNCNPKGSYTGTYTNQFGQSGNQAVILSDDNFVTSGATLSVTPNAFGSYSNTCDSIKIKLWNSINSSYYFFAGKFSNNRTTITGIYKNLTTTSETGPFTLTKQ